jgi:hypothetical protein
MEINALTNSNHKQHYNFNYICKPKGKRENKCIVQR